LHRSTGDDRKTLIGSQGSDLPEQTGLADVGFSQQEHHRSLTSRRTIEGDQA